MPNNDQQFPKTQPAGAPGTEKKEFKKPDQEPRKSGKVEAGKSDDEAEEDCGSGCTKN